MLALLDPKIWLVFILAVGISFAVGHHKGYAESEAEQAAAIVEANLQARQVEQAMTAKLNETTAKLRKENDAAKSQITTLRNDVASGAVRLSIATQASVSTASDTAPTCGNQQARAELDPKAANALISIAADGDEAIRKLNSCIDSYNQVRIK
jgi:prophage endopeptidase